MPMPELPEVETIKLGLERKIVGLTIKDVEIRSPKSFQDQRGKPFDYAQGLRGKKVLKVWRRAKILGVDFTWPLRGAKRRGDLIKNKDSHTPLGLGMTILFHLKMTGQIIFDNGQRIVGGHPTLDMRDAMPNSHTRVVFTFSDNSHLYFNDQRRFGWIRVVKGDKGNLEILNNLGPEPLKREFTRQILKSNLLNHKSQPVKVALMDQKVVSGIGNIYASEACFDAKIDPRKRVGDLGDQEFKDIHKGVIRVIKKGIKYGGSTRANFVDSEGRKGYFLDYAFVYGRDKHPCKVCESEIKKIQLGGRGTYLCPNCQKSYNSF